MKWNFACAAVAGVVMLLSACGEGNSGDGSNASSTAGTLNFWVAPDWAGDIDGEVRLVDLGGTTFENRVTIFKDNRYLRFLLTDNTGFETGAGHDISDWQRGDRHMITATWGDGVTMLYIDGVSVAMRTTYPGTVDIGPDAPLVLGTGSSALTNFSIYTRALRADEVAALFAQSPS